ncbi:hypothetical protein [Hyphomonas sp.]|uniref:hypothetical protein n=1 Tax=Hyphomonas sp. TaxID=87 RepID=UPI003242341A
MGGYTLEQLNQIAQLAVSLMTLIGAPIAVYLFFRDRSIERQDRINEVYRRSSDRYAGFLGLMLSHTDTGVYLHGDDEDLPTDLDRRRSILFEIVTQMLEDAYLVYDRSPNGQRKQQWAGWLAYIRMYCAHTPYIAWWEARIGDMETAKKGASSYDLGFETLMFEELRKAKRQTVVDAAPVL